MKNFITGGAGFIGSHLSDYLLSQGQEVVVLDDLSTGTLANLEQALKNPNFTFVEGDILDRELVAKLVSESDRVFHLAAVVGVNLIVDEPLRGLRTNIHGTESVLDAVREHPRPLLLASTSEVYGKNTADALHEGSDRVLGDPLKSRWTYAAAKGIDEAFAHAYWNQYGVEVSIVRFFNTVGPRQTGRYGMVFPNLVGQALTGRPLTVFGDGLQTRCFSYVHDIVPAMVKILEDPRSRGQAYNLGGAQEISILELAEQIIAQLGSASEITLVPYDQAYGPGYEDMRRRVPDNSKSHELIGFVPNTGVAQIIDAVAADLRARAQDQTSGVPQGVLSPTLS
ncbi:NAD-dependent epimerase/dehydratase family protein [Micrococcoides hystricis]|uniref:UDP-glucuronate decarboxylase n=1 Tax=Micrococcoides hystricis TaxID=1572761 RepID=A0ABV6PBQ6_9MICC